MLENMNMGVIKIMRVSKFNGYMRTGSFLIITSTAIPAKTIDGYWLSNDVISKNIRAKRKS